MSFSESEYAALRQTISSRGTARISLLPVTLGGWAAIAGIWTNHANNPATLLVPLVVLVGGFEAIHAMHVGVERIGRYLQVFYESSPDSPKWETTAMSVGPALPGGGVDPLFTTVFVIATVLNLAAAFLPSPTRLELAVTVLFHAAFLVRLVRARGAATRQRAVDLESYRAIRLRLSSGKD